jgi:rhamnogalacturonyl hydrolase YesR
VANVELANPSDFARSQSPLWLRLYDLGWAEGDPRVSKLRLQEGGEVIATEAIDEDGNGAVDALLALVDLAPNETKHLVVRESDEPPAERKKLTQAELSHKVGGAWQPRADNPKLMEYVGGRFQNVERFTPPPEHTDHSWLIRYEGPGIESDHIAYRFYLDERNGFDIFGKRVNTPVLQQIGLDGFDSYHQMADWGMDILKVGLSLGTGGFGFYDEAQNKVVLVSQVDGRDASITHDGDFTSSLRIAYRNWKVADTQTNLVADFSMIGGSRLVHTRLGLNKTLPNLAVGVVKHDGVDVLAGPTDGPNTGFTYLATWGRQSLSGDALGLAVLVQRGRVQKKITDETSVALVVTPHAVAPTPSDPKGRGGALDYYFLAAWQGEPGGISSKEEFVTYLNHEAERLTIENRVRLSTAVSDAAIRAPLSAEVALEWSARLADSELARKTLDYRHGGWDAHRRRQPNFEYDVVGLQPLAYDELNKERPDPRYAAVLQEVTGSYIADDGTIFGYDEQLYNIDAINPGRNLLRLLDSTDQQKYATAAHTLRRQLKNQPKTSDGAFWHKKKYPSQLWLDGVYMAMPFLARYSQRFEQGASLDEVIREFEVTRARLRDPKTGLYYHGWDEAKAQSWADPTTGRSSQFWGRGMGWFAMALVDVLEVLPIQTYSQQRAALVAMAGEFAQALMAHQDATGTWWQVVDRPGAPGNYREATASAMFTYFLAKAARMGVIDSGYAASAKRAYQGLLHEFVLVHPDGLISVTRQCHVGGLGFGRDGSYRYYMSEPIVRNDPKGNGPFILAGIEIARLLRNEAGTTNN